MLPLIAGIFDAELDRVRGLKSDIEAEARAQVSASAESSSKPAAKKKKHKRTGVDKEL